MQGDTTGQVHRGGQVKVPNQGEHPVPKDSAAEGTKRPMAGFSEFGDSGMMQGMMIQDGLSDIQDGIEAMEKKLNNKKTNKHPLIYFSL